MHEIEFDRTLFENEAIAEHKAGSDDLKLFGPEQALREHRKRLSTLHARALEGTGESLACGKGCWYCCYFKVDVCADEVFEIVSYMRMNLSSENLKKIREEIKNNAKTMKKLDHADKLAVNLKCAFLLDGECSIYPVRPLHCRTFHAKDVEGCISSYEQPHNMNIPNNFVSKVYVAESGCTTGYKKALADEGYSTEHYELNTALSLSLANTGPRKKWEKKKRAFPAIHARE